MRHKILLLISTVLASAAAHAGERSIVLPPVNTSSWEFPTHTNAPRQRPRMGVGFWQRGSGAKPGVGAVYISAMEYQLPEGSPARVHSATFQFSGRPSQCVGNEPVVVDVYAYAGNGRAELADTSAGTRVAQLRADCKSNAAFAQPINVTALVRQLTVPAGVRHIGFNIRKANNRQGPGLFDLAAGKLTVVIAEQDMAARRAQRPLGTAPATAAAAKPAPALSPAARRPGHTRAQEASR